MRRSEKKLSFCNVCSSKIDNKHKMMLLNWRNRSDIRSNMLTDTLISEKDHLKWLDSLKEDAEKKLVEMVFYRSQPIGTIYLMDVDKRNLSASWGFYIGEHDFRGKGLASSMLDRIFQIGFEDLSLNRLYTSVLSSNHRAIAFYIKKGFAVEGCWREHILRDGSFLDLYWMAMLRSQWRR